MTIADTIRSLKPGDRVRVTFEDEVLYAFDDECACTQAGLSLSFDDPTITSIEVIERPLQVGDRVRGIISERRGEITALGRASALVLWDGRPIEDSVLTENLQRAQ